jgi:1-acyl-sn-glycerol-3-phosphate acyltransferase
MKMKMILKKAHLGFYVFGVAVFYFIFWPFFYYCSLKSERFKRLNSLRRRWVITSSVFAGIFYRFEFEQPVDWSKTYIVCPNHTSNLDINAMCTLVNTNCSFMGKQELEDGVVTRLFFRTVDIPVNRDSKMSSFRAFKKAAEKLQSGVTLIIFPEGGIADDYPPRLQEFKNGPFRLAIELKIPILPVTSINTWQIFWDNGKKHGSRPGVCKYWVHKPIDTAHLTLNDADALRDKVYSVMKQQLEQTQRLAIV